MRHVREILRLSLDCRLATRVVGERVGVGLTTARDTLRRFSGFFECTAGTYVKAIVAEIG